jgi:hypothetical protein
MEINWLKQKTRFLTWLLLISTGYSSLLYLHFPLTGIFRLDGTIGVMTGIYVCAHPAANVADFVLYGKHLRIDKLPIRPIIIWWMLNSMVMVAGLFVFVLGLLRYSDFN